MEIPFPNGNCARLVAPPVGTPATSILKTLDIEQPKGVIIVVGGAAGLDETMKGLLLRLFSRGIAFAAASSGSLTIDGGTNAGVMAMMGQGVADRGRKSPLLGIAPAGKVTYPGGPAEGSIEDGAPLDPNHSHFVLVESDEWGGETDTLFDIIKEFDKIVPVVMILANGGLHARKEVLISVREGWPIIVIQGSGRLADEIAIAVREKTEPANEEIVAMVRYDRMTLFDIGKGPEALAAQIHHKLFR